MYYFRALPMKFNFKLEKHGWWQGAIVLGGLIAGAKLKLEAGFIPFTLQTLSLCFTALFFSRQANLIGTLIYMVMGMYLPVFSGEVFGKEFYQGYNAGYVFGFPLAAILITSTKDKYKDWFTIFSWLLMAHALILICGSAWGVFYKDLPLYETVKKGFYALLPGAILKSFIAATLYYIIRKYILDKGESSPSED